MSSTGDPMHHKRSKMKPEEELPSPGAVSVQVKIVYIINNIHICIQLPAAPEPFFGYQTELSLFRQIVSHYQLVGNPRIYQPVYFPPRIRIPYNSWSPAKRDATIGMLTSHGLCLFTYICSLACVSFPPCSYQLPKQDDPLIFETL